jgi:hypothetical protein
MGYPLPHPSRQSVIHAFVLLGVAAFAATAAHVTTPSKGPTDIALAPEPVRTAESRPVDGARPGASLFTTGANSAASTRLEPLTMPEGVIAGGTLSLALDAPAENGGAAQNRSEDSSGSPAARRRSGGGSNGSRVFGGGGGGQWGGVSGNGSRRPEASEASASSAGASSEGSSRADDVVTAPRASESRPSAAPRRESAGVVRSELEDELEDETGPANVPAAPAAAIAARASAANSSTTGTGGSLVVVGSPGSNSPASTPEPLTFLLVGTGLAGLYGMRKRLS